VVGMDAGVGAGRLTVCMSFLLWGLR
jgi:hypothetical protein